jgi:hypothetical protein
MYDTKKAQNIFLTNKMSDISYECEHNVVNVLNCILLTRTYKGTMIHKKNLLPKMEYCDKSEAGLDKSSASSQKTYKQIQRLKEKNNQAS